MDKREKVENNKKRKMVDEDGEWTPVRKWTHEELSKIEKTPILDFGYYSDESSINDVRKNLKEAILKHELDNRKNPTTLEQIWTRLKLYEGFTWLPRTSNAKWHELNSEDLKREPKIFAEMLSIYPETLFQEPFKTIVLEQYEKYLHGDSKVRKASKLWLNAALIPEKRGRGSKARRARKLRPEIKAEICWRLWAFFELLKLELKDINKKGKHDKYILEELFEVRPDLPTNSKWKTKLLKLAKNKKTPQELAIRVTAEKLYISEDSVKEAIHPRK